MPWDAQGRWKPDTQPALAEAAPVTTQQQQITGLLAPNTQFPLNPTATPTALPPTPAPSGDGRVPPSRSPRQDQPPPPPPPPVRTPGHQGQGEQQTGDPRTPRVPGQPAGPRAGGGGPPVASP